MLIHWFRFFSLRVLKRPTPSLRVSILVVAVVLYGATGFLYFEMPDNPSLGWGTAFWYAVVTITTVGYGDYAPATLGGRYLVAVPLMFFGIGLLGYVLSLSASALVEAKAKELSGMSRIKSKGHLVIFNCPGLGKVLRVIEELRGDAEFAKSQTEIVLVDEKLEELPPELAELHVRYIRGNPTRDETLTRANVDQAAQAIVLSENPGDAHSDALSLAITLAIEARNPDVTTVVECVDHETEELLRKAGSDRIVCTSRFDAHFLSQEMLNPGVQEVIAQLTSNLDGQQVYLTQVSEGLLSGSSIKYAEAVGKCKQAGHVLLGLRNGASLTLNPDENVMVHAGAQLITIGPSRLQL